jgi:hypothetical protein
MEGGFYTGLPIPQVGLHYSASPLTVEALNVWEI